MNQPTSPRGATAIALLLPALLAGLPGHAAAQGPLGDKCNPNVLSVRDTPDAAGGPGGQSPATVTGTPLEPGYTCKTKGTNPDESPELVGTPVITDDTGTFSFSDPTPPDTLPPPGKLVSGTYQQMIVRSNADSSLKQYIRFNLVSGCLARVRFNQYHHENLPIVADFRDDVPGLRRSDYASRSADGLVFEFHLQRNVCAGQTTRWLLLNTSIFQMSAASALELITPKGNSSGPLPTYVPTHAP
ncbi:MAG: hypothetical protein U1F53_11715 [Burkholderiaceae bacterium]